MITSDLKSLLNDDELEFVKKNPKFILKSIYNRCIKSSNLQSPFKESVDFFKEIILSNGICKLLHDNSDSDGDGGVKVYTGVRLVSEDISKEFDIRILFTFKLKLTNIFNSSKYVKFIGIIEPLEDFYEFNDNLSEKKQIRSKLKYPIYRENTKGIVDIQFSDKTLTLESYKKNIKPYSIKDLLKLPMEKYNHVYSTTHNSRRGVFVHFNIKGFNTLIKHKKIISSLGDKTVEEILSQIKNVLKEDVPNQIFKKQEFEKEEIREKEEVKKRVSSIISEEFDKDQNGRLDLIEGDNLLLDLLNNNQSIIIEFDHHFLQSLVSINTYLNTKRDNLQNIFEILHKVDTYDNFDEVVNLLKQGMDNYQSLLIHSMNMVISLKNKNLLNFYTIRETFEGLGIFESPYEKGIRQLLKGINLNLSKVNINLSNIQSELQNIQSEINNLTNQMKSMENHLSTQLDELTEVTKSSFESLNTSLTEELKSIKSGVGLNNLLTGISTYQLYKINKNTKPL